MLIVSLLLSGCSVVTLDRYYAPVLSNNETYRDTHCAHRMLAGGANEVAVLKQPLISFEIRQIRQDVSLITAGPLYFAIIPAFPLNWVTSPDNPKDILDIRITITSLSNDLVWSLDSMKLILTDGRVITPSGYDTEKRDFSAQKSPSIPLTLSGKLWIWDKNPSIVGYSFWVRYPLDRKKDKSFKLEPGKITVGNEEIIFPQTAFTWNKGWSYCFVP